MNIPQRIICQDIEERILKTKEQMEHHGFDALIVYGNNKVYGSLRYLTDYFPDRAGWVSFDLDDIYLFDGAALVLTQKTEPILMLERGLVLGKDICTTNVKSGAWGAAKESGLTAKNVARILHDAGASGIVGIETWERFPAPLYLDLIEEMPNIQFKQSRIVESLRMVKTPLEIEIFQKAAAIGDLAHEVFKENLRDGIGRTELELIRLAEQTMRFHDPIYEDSCENSPSLICSGYAVGGSLLHLPQHSKIIQPGDAVHWDICTRYNGYAIDTSRTKVIGKPKPLQTRAYDTTVNMLEETIKIAKPGVPAVELVNTSKQVAKDAGFELLDGFVGHGIGLDAHERPDLVAEGTPLEKNMVLAIEPRIAIDETYILGLEDMVLITEDGGVPLTQFEKQPLEI
ncbi:M24 family metallopeptidase [Chloroflexota bacterium]